MQQLTQDFYGMNTSNTKITKTLDLNKVKSIVFENIELLLESFDNVSKRESGTGTIPMLGSIVQKG